MVMSSAQIYIAPAAEGLWMKKSHFDCLWQKAADKPNEQIRLKLSGFLSRISTIQQMI